MSIPDGSSAGAEAASASPSTLMSRSSCLGGGGGGGFIPANGEPLRSIALDNCLIAFSMTGSTYLRIPSLLSKSSTAGIILLKLYILLNTLIKGWLSSNLLIILLVKAFYMLWTAFFLAAAASYDGFFFASI
jgi:hypothetical protein